MPLPSALKPIVITCKTDFHRSLNLPLIAQQITLDTHIKGIKYVRLPSNVISVGDQQIIRGLIKSKKNKKDTNTRRRLDFSNQCTIVVAPQPDVNPKYLLNLKIFSNGRTIVTGATSIDHVQLAMQLVSEQFDQISTEYSINLSVDPLQWLNQRFTNYLTYQKFLEKNYLVLLKLIELYDYRLSLNLNQILLSTDHQEVVQLLPEHLMISGEILDYLQLIQLYDIAHLYFSNDQLLTILPESKPELQSKFNIEPKQSNFQYYLHQLVLQSKSTMPAVFRSESYTSTHFKIDITNYNSMFSANYQINRIKLTELLINQYHLSALFNPSIYQGVNAKYICRLACKQKTCSFPKNKKSKCGCKQLSFLIFQEGTVIIAGARNTSQAQDGYQLISTILQEHYSHLVVHEAKHSDKLELPDQLYDPQTKQWYLNKQTYLQEHPRNYYLYSQARLSI